MRFIGWMYDIAREQWPSELLLHELVERSAAAGYNAIGLYLEHSFAYPSAPWAADADALLPDTVRRLCAAAPRTGVRVIPFLNTLGHMEGFIRAEGGQWLSEGHAGFGSAQMCPSRPECIAFARGLVDDAMAAFDDEWLHLGGDETRQLGQCPLCAERVARVGKGGLYTDYFAGLCRYVAERGRRPCLWGDMLLQHPDAIDALPRETVIFDWQYFQGPGASTAFFRDRGFDVVCCPSLQTYNSGWCYLDASRENIDEHRAVAQRLGALGVLLTTWEFAYFSQYVTVWPLIFAAGRRIARNEEWPAAIAAEGGDAYARAAELLGVQMPASCRFLAPGTWRQLRDRLAIRLDPFALWRDWRAEACGSPGEWIVELCAAVDRCGVESLAFPSMLHRVAVECTRSIEQAYLCYRAGDNQRSMKALNNSASQLASLRPNLAVAAAHGSSRADVERVSALVANVTRVVDRLATANFSNYRPSFELLTSRNYVPGERSGWTVAANSL